MAELDSIIDVQITLATAGVEQAGFGVPLIAGFHENWAERTRVYNQPSDMLEPGEGFTATDPLYLAAVATKAQSPKPPQFKIGRIAEKTTQGHTVTIVDPTTHGGAATDVEGKTYTITIDGIAYSVTPALASGDDFDDVAGDLVTAITGAPGITVPAYVPASGEVIFSATVPGVQYTLEVAVNSGDVFIEQKNTSTDPGITASLNAILNEDSAWYGLSLVSQSEEEINAAAGVISATEKLFAAASADSDILDPGSSTDVASDNTTQERTGILYSENPYSYPAAALLGRMLPTDPGSATWKFKRLVGITPSSLSPTNIATLQAKNCNFYRDLGGLPITCDGTVGTGEYFDTIRGRDWLKARMQERIYSVLVNNDKVPFTDAGIGQIVNEVRAQLGEAVTQGYLSDDPFDADADLLQPFTITFPRAADVSAPNRAARILPDLEFAAKLAGAVHKIEIQGVISL